MSTYTMSILALLLALIGQAIASGLSIEYFLRNEIPRATRRAWFAIGLGSLLLALHHGYTVELALRTGLYDFRQAILASLVGILFGLGVFGLMRR